jgi:glycosyltransferase involved in cell wall biosynthesis
MNILIVRTEGPKIDPSAYDIPEIELAKAFVRAGHQADVVLYGGLSDDSTTLMPVDDTGVIRMDERLLGDDAYVTEGSIDGDDPDRFISVYSLTGLRLGKGCIFFSLRGMAENYDYIMLRGYDRLTSWLCYSNRKYRDKAVIYEENYDAEGLRRIGLRQKIFDRTLFRHRSAPYTMCYAVSDMTVDYLRSRGFKNVYRSGSGTDTDSLDEAVEDAVPVTGIGDLDTEFGRAYRRAAAIRGEGKAFTFMFRGHLDPMHNIGFVLDLAEQLISSHDDVRLIVLGDGEVEYKAGYLSRMKKRIAEGRIIYASGVSREELATIYKITDCVLNPVLYDPWGSVLYESVYYDTPVITSRCGGADILIENGRNGLIPENMVTKTWLDAAEQIYGDADMRARFKVAMLEDRDSLRWDNAVRRMLKTWPGRG